MTSDPWMQRILALSIVAAFFVVLGVILVGVVDIQDPTMAKIVGAAMGFVGGKVDVILYRYFGRPEASDE